MHVLSAPPAFVLSQDQTLSFILDPHPACPQHKTRDTGARSSAHASKDRKANTPIRQRRYRPHQRCTSNNAPPAHPFTSTNDDVKERGKEAAAKPSPKTRDQASCHFRIAPEPTASPLCRGPVPTVKGEEGCCLDTQRRPGLTTIPKSRGSSRADKT